MPDFFGKEEPEPEVEETTEEVESIKLGDKEYSQDELNSLVELGGKAQEIQKHHGDLDKFVSEFGRRGNDLGKLRTELDDLKKPQPEPVDPNNEMARQQSQEAARKLGLTLNDEFKGKQEENFRELYLRERAAEKILEQGDKLEGEIDGKDGRPKFDKQEVLQYMQESGIRNMGAAYDQKYKDQLDVWRAEQIIKSKKPGLLTTEQPSTAKAPPEVKITADNLEDAMKEALYHK